MSWKQIALPLAFVGLAGFVNAQEWRQGKGRLEGIVADEKGAPIADAKVSLRFTESGKGPDLKTNQKGHWAVLGLTGGAWTVEASAPGHMPFKQSVNVTELGRVPSVDIQLAPEVKQQPAETVVTVGGQKISKETAAAIEKGNEAIQSKNFPEAEASYTKALAELPDNSALLLNTALAYYFDQKYDDALKYARQVVEKDPAASKAWLMIAELELRNGRLEEGKAAMEKVPDSDLVNGEPYMNLGILYYNKGKSVEAEASFSKAVAKSPDLAEGYYYRGLSRLQAKRNAEAKADLQKYLELKPDGKDADTAKELLKSIK